MNSLSAIGFNIIVRGLSLAARFVIIVILARALGPEQFGTFTLITTTEIVAILVLGYEFNAFSRREIVVARDDEIRARYVRDQMTITSILGLGAPLIAFGGAIAHLYPLSLSPFVSIIIYVELIAQEGIRVLYALQRVAMGNLVWFVRSSLWVFLLAAMLLLAPDSITLLNVLKIWIVFAAASIGLLFWSLRGMHWSEAFKSSVDWQWIRRGFKIALPFYVSTIFLNLLNYMPRYTLFYLRGAHETGVFGLYTGIAVGVVNLVSTTTVPAGIAHAVKALAHDGRDAFAREMRRLWLQCAGLTLLLSAGLFIFFPFIQPFVGSKGYPMDWILLALILIAFAAQIAATVAQTALYAMHKDREILVSCIGSGILSAFIQIGLTYLAGMRGLAAAMALSMLVLTLLFMYFERRAIRQQLDKSHESQGSTAE